MKSADCQLAGGCEFLTSAIPPCPYHSQLIQDEFSSATDSQYSVISAIGTWQQLRSLLTRLRLTQFWSCLTDSCLLYFSSSGPYILSRFMEIDFQAIQTDELKSRIGELRRYL